MDTLLESKVFVDDLGKEIFTEWLAMTDSIEPRFVTREKFTALGDNFFQKKEIDPDQQHKGPQPYNLYLPTDMKMGEILSVVDIISREVGKEDRVSMTRLASMINTKLRYLIKKGVISKREIEQWQKDYNVSEETVALVRNAKLSPSALRSVYGHVDDWALSKEATKAIQYDLLHSLDTVFFERGTESLFEWMEVFTQGDRDELSEDVRESDANRRRMKEYFDSEEKKLSEKIGMVDLMAESEAIQDKNSPEWKDFVVKVAGKILEEVYSYPYISNGISNHNIKNLLEKKEMVCLTKSILMHIFLKKLWIVHYAMGIPDHSAINIPLWEDEYMMDSVEYSYLRNLKDYSKSEVWAYTCVKDFYGHKKDLLYQIGNPIDIFQSQLYYNKWYDWRKKPQKAMIYYTKAIEINPLYAKWWNAIWLFYFQKWEYKKAKDYYNKSYTLNPYAYHVWNNIWAIYVKEWEYMQACQCFLVAAALDTWREDITYTDRARLFAYNQIQSPEEKRALKELKRIDDLPFDDAKKASVKEIIGKKIYSRDPVIR